MIRNPKRAASSCALIVGALIVMLLLYGGRYSSNTNVLRTSASTSTSVKALCSTNSSGRLHRILAFGDSLTAGTSGLEEYPYAPFLEQALRARHHNAVVRYRGNPGSTTDHMLDDLDGDRTGLRSAIRAVRDPPLSLVIIMAGTNDLGRGKQAHDIAHNLFQLHEICYENNVPRTIAIGIPPSGYQRVHTNGADLAQHVNGRLRRFCSTEERATYFPFPFDFVVGGENWHHDSLHFSKQGYQVLGESLVPVVEEILKSLDADHHNTDDCPT